MKIGQLNLRNQLTDALSTSRQKTISPGNWRKGDRVRVRDFVFQIETAFEGKAGVTFLCTHAWLIYSNRIFVPLTADRVDADSPSEVHAVSRLMVLQKWSAATDLYSVGVLLLYSLFYGNNPKDDARSDVDKDAEFANMIAVVSSPIYARAMIPRLWDGVQLLRRLTTEAPYKDRSTFSPKELKKLSYRLDSARGSEVGVDSKVQDVDARDSVDEYLQLVANSFASSTPGLSNVMHAVGRNVADFILAVHVALSLMHRKEDFGRIEGDSGVSWKDSIVANSRIEEPSSAVTQAVCRLIEQVRNITKDSFTRDLIIDADRITVYEPASEATVILEKKETQLRNAELERQVAALNDEIQMGRSLMSRFDALNRRLGEARKSMVDEKDLGMWTPKSTKARLAAVRQALGPEDPQDGSSAGATTR